MINRLFGQRDTLLLNFVMSFSLKCCGVLFGFIVTYLVAREVTLEIAGSFFFYLSISVVIGTVLKLGLDQPIIKFVSTTKDNNDRKSIVFYSIIISSIFSVIIILLGATTSYFGILDVNFSEVLLLLSHCTFWALFNLLAMGYQGEGKNRLSVFFLNLGQNLIFLILFLILQPTNTTDLLKILVCSSCLNFVFSALLFFSNFRLKRNLSSEKELLKHSLPLLLASIFGQINFWGAQIFLGIFSTESEVAIFAVCQRISFLVSFVLTTLNLILAPKFATLYSENKIKELEKLATRSILITLIFSLPIFIAILVFPTFILSSFGPEFTKGSEVLVILIMAQLVNALCGPVMYLLSMCNFQKLVKNCTFQTSLIMVFGSLFFAGFYDMYTASLITASAIVYQNILASYYVNKHIGLRLFALKLSKND